MTSYTLALFVHLVGAIGVFVGVGVWFFTALALRRTQDVAQVRALAGLTVASGNVAVGGVLLIAAAGLYMVVTVWGWQTDWIDVATISFALLAPLGVVVIDSRLRAIAKAADTAPDGPLPASLRARTHDPLLSGGLLLYVAVLLGIVFLMATKPHLLEAILVMCIAAILGLVAAVLLWWTSHVPRPAMTHGS